MDLKNNQKCNEKTGTRRVTKEIQTKPRRKSLERRKDLKEKNSSERKNVKCVGHWMG